MSTCLQHGLLALKITISVPLLVPESTKKAFFFFFLLVGGVTFFLSSPSEGNQVLLELVKGTSCQHTVSHLPHTPALKSTFAGKFPKSNKGLN